MAKKDYYDVLGVERGADEKQLNVLTKLAMQYHPDRTKGDKAKEEKFKEIQEAYEILGDKEKRAAYDQHGHAAFEQGGMGGGGFGGGFSGADFGDIFGDMFGDIFGGGGRGRQRVVRGEDLRYDIQITLEEAVKVQPKISKLIPLLTVIAAMVLAQKKDQKLRHAQAVMVQVVFVANKVSS